MARINLLTIHYSDNNGAFLQTYSTCEILRQMGHTVTIINLVDPNWYHNRFRYFYNLKLFFRYAYFEFCRRRFFPARTLCMFAPDIKNIPDCDYTIVGSDQVWNKSITGFSYMSYFLDFLSSRAVRLSLASSFGCKDPEFETDERARIKSCLSAFKAISVREQSGGRIIRDFFGLNAVTLPDPTIALGNFDRLIGRRKIRRRYVGLFTFKPAGYSMQVAKKISSALGHRLLWVNSYPFYFSCREYIAGHIEIQSPREWLSYIKNADFFVCDSFHGVVFCLIFHTRFVALNADDAKLERILSLLETFGLQRRLVRTVEEIEERLEELLEPVNWIAVDDVMAVQRKMYIHFLQENLNDEQ